MINNQYQKKITIEEDRGLRVRILKQKPLFFHKKTFVQVNHSNRSVNLGSENEALKTVKNIIKNNKENIIFKIRKNIE